MQCNICSLLRIFWGKSGRLRRCWQLIHWRSLLYGSWFEIKCSICRACSSGSQSVRSMAEEWTGDYRRRCYASWIFCVYGLWLKQLCWTDFSVWILSWSDLARGLDQIQKKFVTVNKSKNYMKFIIFFPPKILVYSYSTIIWNDNFSHKNFILRQVRGVVCDNHAANVLTYKKLKEEYLDEVEGLSINYQGQWVYLFYDTVHLVKNIRNNLLSNKRFLFPDFNFFSARCD